MSLNADGRTELALSGGGCTCCAVDAAPTHLAVERADAAAPDPVRHSTEFGVEGMTCGNCVRHVTEELSEVYGVEAVDIELVADGVSTVTVRSSSPVDAAEIAAAVAEAGYEVVAR
jgi:copper chaperone